MTNARLLFVHALSPLHAGTGQGVGVIDLPIAREKATGLPYLPGSSVKGTLRDNDGLDPVTQQALFGPDTNYAADNAGSAQFSDQRLLLLPVRSLAGTFAWVTSPYVLRRFARDAQDAGATDLPKTVPTITRGTGDNEYKECAVASGSCLKISGQTVVLEDLDLTATEDSTKDGDVTKWADWIGWRLFPDKEKDAAWRTMLTERFCIVHDDLLGFLLTTATEVVARIKLNDDSKTVDTKTGALWYEEALPAETVLAGLVVATPVNAKIRDKDGNEQSTKRLTSTEIFKAVGDLTDKALQFGGKATVGRGLCRVVLANETAAIKKTEEGQHANP